MNNKTNTLPTAVSKKGKNVIVSITMPDIKSDESLTILPNLCSIETFAIRKGVKRQSVYYQIHSTNLIKPIFIGAAYDMYIDWEQYKDFEFREYPREKRKSKTKQSKP